MDASRWMPLTGLALLLALTAGCVATDDVVYVDEQGNEIALDEDGQPLMPPGGLEVAPSRDVAVGDEVVVRERMLPSGTAADRPANEGTPPAAPSFGGAAKPNPNLDLPPAGSAASPLDAPPTKPEATSVKRKPPVKPKAPAKKKKTKKIEDSSALDLPPAG